MSDLQRKLARAELSRRAFIVTIAFLAALVSGSLLVLALQIRQSQIEGTPFGQQLLKSSDRIIDCTAPEGDCYRKNQERTAAVISALNDGALFAVLCVQRNPDVVDLPPEVAVPKIRACLADLAAAQVGAE